MVENLEILEAYYIPYKSSIEFNFTHDHDLVVSTIKYPVFFLFRQMNSSVYSNGDIYLFYEHAKQSTANNDKSAERTFSIINLIPGCRIKFVIKNKTEFPEEKFSELKKNE